MTPARIPFDRVADRYDATRGGEQRARRTADAIGPWLPPGLVVGLGVGTGAIAAALGRPAVGIDLSLPMLAKAAERLPGRVAQGDVLAPPLRADRAAGVLAIQVLHLVGDLDAALRAVADLLVPGGRLVGAGFGGDELSEDDMTAAIGDLGERLRPTPAPTTDDVVAAASGAGLGLVHEGRMARADYEDTPNRVAALLESRAWSWCWDVPDDVWAAEVEPVIAAVRALPDPDRPRPRWNRRHFLVWEKP